MNNLRKFATEAEYTAATLSYPSVAWITSTDAFHFDKENPAPPTPATFSGLTVHYNITDISLPTQLFHAAGGSGSGSGSGSGGVLPSAMIIDGTEVEVTNAYQFSTTGEHIVNYSFADNQVPKDFLYGGSEHIFNNVVKVEIGDAITSITSEAFLECYGLTSCTIRNGVTTIGISAFQSCSGLTSITIPDSVTSISDSAFQYCTSLTSVTIPDSVTSIGTSAFKDCSGLTSVTIGNSVTSISDGAFSLCGKLTRITSNVMTAPTLGYNVFDGISYNGVLTVPSGSQGYCVWKVNLPSYWTIEGVTCE